MKNVHYVYLLLSIVGGGFTSYYIFVGMRAENWNFDVLSFMQSTWTMNPYSRSITCDFWTGATAGSIFMLAEGLRIKLKYLYVYVMATFLVGFAFAFPLFLFVRHRAINQS